MQSALSKTKGVQKATVSSATNEAEVAYNPKMTNPKLLVKAVDEAHGMGHYRATIKATITVGPPIKKG